MNITFTITLDEQGIPQLIGLLSKMLANPDPGQQVIVETHAEAPTRVKTAKPETAPAPDPANHTATLAPPQTALTVAQVQQAAGAFVDVAPGNMAVLQGILKNLGAQAVTQLKPEQLQLFAAQLREKGGAL